MKPTAHESVRDPTLLPPREQRGCPPGETWIALVGGAPPAGERETLLDHLAICPDCSNEVRALRDVAAWSRKVGGHPASVRRPLATWPWAAALAALVLLPFLTLLIRRDPEKPVVRGNTALAASIEPGDGATIEAAPLLLRWSAVGGAREYRAQLLDDEASLLWESPPHTEPRATLPAEVRARLRRGRTYLWRVEILLDGDRRSSPTYEFRLAP